MWGSFRSGDVNGMRGNPGPFNRWVVYYSSNQRPWLIVKIFHFFFSFNWFKNISKEVRDFFAENNKVVGWVGLDRKNHKNGTRRQNG